MDRRVPQCLAVSGLLTMLLAAAARNGDHAAGPVTG